MPFAGYEDFDDCVRQNQDKDDPEAYCARIQREVEGSSVTQVADPKDRKPSVVTKNLVERKNVVLQEVKFDESKGTFTGYASVFGVKDLQGDIIQPGAFAKTIRDNDGLFVLLDQHQVKQEIGLVTAQEDEKGLFVEGKFYIDPEGDTTKDVDGARSTYNKMAYRFQAGKPLQMSIGYRAINPKFERGARILREIGLAEVSTVTFPAMPDAVTTGVKGQPHGLKNFQEDYQDAVERAFPWMALDIALMYVYDCIYDFIFDELYMNDGDLTELRQDIEAFTEAVIAQVSTITGLDEGQMETAQAHMQERHEALKNLLVARTDPEEPSPEGHSEGEAAGKSGTFFLQEVARLRDRMKNHESPSPEEDAVKADLWEQVRKIRAQAKEQHGG